MTGWPPPGDVLSGSNVRSGSGHDLVSEGRGDGLIVAVVGGDVGDLDAPRLDQRDEAGAPALQDADQADRRVGKFGPVDDPPGWKVWLS